MMVAHRSFVESLGRHGDPQCSPYGGHI